MRHGNKNNALGRKKAHRDALLSNLAISLIEHKRIETTLAKARALRIYVEPLITKSKDDTMRAVLAQVLPNDVLHFGMIPELVGRLPIICPLMPLDRDAMISILTEPKNAVIRQYQYLFTLEGAQLEFSRDALELIADRALARETGARALRAVIDEIMVPHMYHLPEMQNRDAVYSLTADAIERKLPLTQFVRHVGKESA